MKRSEWQLILDALRHFVNSDYVRPASYDEILSLIKRIQAALDNVIVIKED